jgi:hypothetical protein
VSILSVPSVAAFHVRKVALGGGEGANFEMDGVGGRGGISIFEFSWFRALRRY